MVDILRDYTLVERLMAFINGYLPIIPLPERVDIF